MAALLLYPSPEADPHKVAEEMAASLSHPTLEPVVEQSPAEWSHSPLWRVPPCPFRKGGDPAKDALYQN